MNEHYYSKNPSSRHEEQTFETELRGLKLTFTTDSGVFSRDQIDFGSRLLIETMDIPQGAKVLDVGCGYGPIGITAAKLHPDNRVTMADVNERAIQLAKHNAVQNGAANVSAIVSDVYGSVTDRDYDVVLTNPPIRAGKPVVHAILVGAKDVLKEGGSLWVVIQKKQGAPSALEKLKQWYGDVQEVDKDKGYRIFRATK